MEAVYLTAGLFGVGLALYMMEPATTMGADGQPRPSKKATKQFRVGPSSMAHVKPEHIESEEDAVDPLTGRAYTVVTLKCGSVFNRYKDVNGNDPTA